MYPVRSRARTIVLIIAGIFGAAVATLVFTLPPDVQLGTTLRLVIYHGAQTWVNMATFTLAAVASLLYLILRREGVYRWAAGLRYLSVALWVLNTGLGLLSSKIAWGAINFDEPRLQATFYLLLGAGLVLAVDFVFNKWVYSALADIAMAGAMWWLILGAANFVHPDNPVLNSGWEIKAPFFGIVGGIFVTAILIASLIAGRIPAEGEI